MSMIDTITLGDAYKLIKEIPDKSVDLIVTDPPYEFGSRIHESGILKGRHNNYCDEISGNNLDKGINIEILDEFVRVLKKINCYIWCNKEQIYNYLTYFVKERKCNYEFIIWAKENPIPFCGGHYLKDKEYCLYFWETGVNVSITYKTGKTVYVSKTNVEDKKIYGHPTIKPINIIETLILNSSERGGIILDPFSGSGTTARAAKNTNRHYIAFEINKDYYETSLKRLREGTQVKLF